MGAEPSSNFGLLWSQRNGCSVGDIPRACSVGNIPRVCCTKCIERSFIVSRWCMSGFIFRGLVSLYVPTVGVIDPKFLTPVSWGQCSRSRLFESFPLLLLWWHGRSWDCVGGDWKRVPRRALRTWLKTKMGKNLSLHRCACNGTVWGDLIPWWCWHNGQVPCWGRLWPWARVGWSDPETGGTWSG